MKKLIFILSLLLTTNFSAQIIWGAGSGNPISEQIGQFSNPFGTLNAWSAQGVNNPNSLWSRSTTGTSQGAYSNSLPAMSSPTFNNGVALFDSDFLDNGGTAGNFGGGLAPAPQIGELVSPSFDLTGYTNVQINAKFYLYYRNFNISQLQIGFSSDNGATWSDFSMVPQLVSGNAVFPMEQVSVPLTDVTTNVSDLTQCKLRLRFDGNYYFVMVDDISLETIFNYDFTLEAADSSGSSPQDLGKEILITNNRHYPASQVLNAELAFGGNVKNLGVMNVLPSDSLFLNLAIQQNTGTWSTVYSQSKYIPSLVANSAGSLVFDTILDNSWIEVGEFRAIYTISSNVLDANTSNDSSVHYFNLNDNSLVSKVELSAQMMPIASSSIMPQLSLSYIEYGTIYSFPSGGDENLKIDSVAITMRAPNNYLGTSSQSVYVNIYEWNDIDAGNSLSNLSELTILGRTVVSFSGITSGGSYSDWAKDFVHPTTGDPLPLMDNDSHYFISIEHNPNAFGGPAIVNDNELLAFGVSSNQNYSLNLIASENAFPSPLIVTDQSNGFSLYGLGFGASNSPSIAVKVSVCAPDSVFDVITSCSPITWIDGNTYDSTNNTAMFVYTNINGCDSVVMLDLTITNVTTAVSLQGETITASQSGANYQWINCDNNQAIGGQTNQSFTATVNGNYAVVVSLGACSDTSSCTTISTIGLNELPNSSELNIYPNPNKGIFTMKAAFIGELLVFNEFGQVVKNIRTTGSELQLVDLSELQPGLYYILGVGNNDNVRHKIVITK